VNDPVKWDLTIRKGREFSEWFGLRNDDDTPMDLTSYTVRAQIRADIDIAATLIADFSVRIDDPATGDIYLELTDAQTSALTARRGYYDLLLTDPSGIDETYAEGTVIIKGSVTSNA